MIGEILGSFADAGLGLVGAKYQHDLNQSSADHQMNWQRNMSNTSHQRQVEDLKKAGLNPILSANAGASATGGAAGTASAPPPTSFASTALQSKKLSQEKLLMASQIGKNSADTAASKEMAQLYKQNVQTAKQTEIATALQNKMNQAGLANFMKGLKKESKQLDFDIDTQDFKNLNNLINDGLGTANSAVGLINPLKGLKIGTPNKTPSRRLP